MFRFFEDSLAWSVSTAKMPSNSIESSTNPLVIQLSPIVINPSPAPEIDTIETAKAPKQHRRSSIMPLVFEAPAGTCLFFFWVA
jgi:hypothetical protein